MPTGDATADVPPPLTTPASSCVVPEETTSPSGHSLLERARETASGMAERAEQVLHELQHLGHSVKEKLHIDQVIILNLIPLRSMPFIHLFDGLALR